MNKQEILLAQKEFLFPAVFHYFKDPLVISHAKDQYVWDADGKQYLDFFGGIVTVSVGHCNDQVNKKVHEQIDKLEHVSTVFVNEPQVALAQKLASITPAGALRKSFFTNSGTEANETAILAARCFTGSTEIVALRHSYHGRSSAAMGMSGQAPWKLGPPQAGVVHAVNAYCYRCPFGLEYPSCEVKCAQDIEELIQTTTTGQIAGFLAEPIMGVGGFITAPDGYFKVAVDIIKKYGGVFICDEVQTGFGRTGGKMWGIEHHEGVEPDIMTMAKGIANGLPIGAVLATAAIADSWRGGNISTYGGNPISAAAANATIDTIVEEKLTDNAFAMGKLLHEGLLAVQKKFPKVIGDVRGKGLMQGLELVKDETAGDRTPAPEAAVRLFEETKKRGLLIGKGGLYGNVIRIAPALNIGKADITEGLRIIDESFTAMQA